MQAITGSTRYTVVFAVILIAGYIIKDRIKEWGKRCGAKAHRGTLEHYMRLSHATCNMW